MEASQYYYHLTTKQNLPSIKNHGLVPFSNRSRYGSMSSFITRKDKVVFLIPGLNIEAIHSFFNEWWHGDRLEVVLLRIPKENVIGVEKDKDEYISNHEVVTRNIIKPDNLSYIKLGRLSCQVCRSGEIKFASVDQMKKTICNARWMPISQVEHVKELCAA